MNRGRVLIVDDDADLREALRFIVAGEGFEVVEAADGRMGLEALRRAPADVVLLDMRMPSMDGWEFLRRLDQSGRPRPSIVVMTAALDAGEVAEQVGADAWLPKPFELDDVMALVTKLGHHGVGASP